MQPDALYYEFRDPPKGAFVSRWVPLTLPPHRWWLRFRSVHFDPSASPALIIERLRQMFDPRAAASYNVYLEAEPTDPRICYPIDTPIQQCLGGDRRIARRLAGRTIWAVHRKTAPSGVNLFSADEVQRWLTSLNLDLPEGAGVRCALPSFCATSGIPPTEFPWHPNLMHESHLPLLFQDTYASAHTRLLFWDRAVRQLRSACLDTLARWCHRRGLALALHLPDLEYQGLPLSLSWFDAADAVIVPMRPSGQIGPWTEAQVLLGSAASARPVGRETLAIAPGAAISPTWQVPTGLDLLWNPGTPESTAWKRAAYLATRGVPTPRIGILYPSESLWIEPETISRDEFVDVLYRWTWELRGRGFEVQMLDPLTLLDGSKFGGSSPIRVGTTEFFALIVPPSVSYSTRVLSRLKDFVDQGGTLLFLRPAPYLTDGRVSLEDTPLDALLRHRSVEVLDAEDDLDAWSALERFSQWLRLYRRPENDPAEGIWRRERILGSLRWAFLWNSGVDALPLLAEMPGEYRCELWDPATGERKSLPTWQANSYTYTELELASGEQKVLVTW